MKLSTLLVIIAVAVFILALVMFPELRTLLSGFTRLLIKDAASTPEGARSVFEQQIQELQEVRDNASNSYRLSAGRLSSEQKRNKQLKARLEQLEKDCEALVKAGRMEDAEIKAEERNECLKDIERSEVKIKAFTDSYLASKEAFEGAEANLKKAKINARDTVENMELQKTLKEVYDQLDENRASTGTEKMVSAIMDKNKDLTEMVEGSRTIHNSKLSTRSAKADENAKKAQNDAYLESLRKKYNK